MSEREKMLAGELYLASDPELAALRRPAAGNPCRVSCSVALGGCDARTRQ
jgi:hypothetical protein